MPDPQKVEKNPYAISDEEMQEAVGAPKEEAPEPSTMQKVGQGAMDLGKGAVKGALSTAQHVGSMIFPNTLAAKFGMAPGSDEAFQPHGTMQNIGKGAEQIGEFFLPSGIEEEGANLLSKAAPKLAKFAKPIMRMAGGEAVNEAQGGPVGAGAAGAGVGEAVGAGMRAAAPYAAETAMRIPTVARAFNKTPGRAILEHTTGILPATVGRTAQDSASRLGQDLDASATKIPGTPASLTPARQGLTDVLNKRETQQAPAIFDPVSEMHDTLSAVPRGPNAGTPIPADVSAPELIAIKRGFSDQHLGRWNPDVHQKATSAGRQAYHALDAEQDRIMPEAKETNQTISSLIPVIHAADKAERAPSFFQRTAGRFAAHTGALSGGIGGAAFGYHQGGLPGAIAGGAAGILGPELVASPESQMMLARTLHSPGVQRAAVPLAAAASSKASSAVRDRKKDQ